MQFSSTRNDPLSSVFLVWFKLFTNSLFFHLAFGSVSLALFMIAKIMTSDTKKSILIKNPFIAAQRDRSHLSADAFQAAEPLRDSLLKLCKLLLVVLLGSASLPLE